MFFSYFFLFFFLIVGLFKFLNSGVSLWIFVINIFVCFRIFFFVFSYVKFVCELDCIEIFLVGRCDKVLSLGITN